MSMHISDDPRIKLPSHPELPWNAKILWEPFLKLGGMRLDLNPNQNSSEIAPSKAILDESIEILEYTRGPGAHTCAGLTVPANSLLITFRAGLDSARTELGTAEYGLNEQGEATPLKLVHWAYTPMAGNEPKLVWRHPDSLDPNSINARMARFGAPLQGVDALFFNSGLDMETAKLWVSEYYRQIDSGNIEFFLSRVGLNCIYRRGKSEFNGKDAIEKLFRNGRPPGIRHEEINAHCLFSNGNAHVFVEGSYSVPHSEPGRFADHWIISNQGEILARSSSFFAGEDSVTRTTNGS